MIRRGEQRTKLGQKPKLGADSSVLFLEVVMQPRKYIAYIQSSTRGEGMLCLRGIRWTGKNVLFHFAGDKQVNPA